MNCKGSDTTCAVEVIFNYTCSCCIWRWWWFTLAEVHSQVCILVWYGIMHKGVVFQLYQELASWNLQIWLPWGNIWLLSFSKSVGNSKNNRKRTLTAWLFKLSDEKMLVWRPHTLKTGGFSHTSFIERKPEPLDDRVQSFGIFKD